MKETRMIVTAGAVALVFGLGMVACSGSMGSGGSSAPSTTASATSSSGEPSMPTDTSSGPAYRTVSGHVVKIEAPYYDVQEYTGNKVRLHVNNKTVMIGGTKKVGDKIRAEITRGGHANSVQ